MELSLEAAWESHFLLGVGLTLLITTLREIYDPSVRPRTCAANLLRPHMRQAEQQAAGVAKAGSEESSAGHALFEHERLPEAESLQRSAALLACLESRRTLRFFDSARSFDRQILLNAALSACTAPSGAHQQPWHFSVSAAGRAGRAARATRAARAARAARADSPSAPDCGERKQ